MYVAYNCFKSLSLRMICYVALVIQYNLSEHIIVNYTMQLL